MGSVGGGSDPWRTADDRDGRETMARDSPLEEPANLYRKLLEAEGRLGEGVLVYDLADDEIVFATGTFFEILDATPEQIETLPDITHLVADEHRPELLEKMQGFLEGETIQDHEFPIVLDDGSWRWLRAGASLLGPADTRIVVTIRDVTEEVRAETERELLLELTRATAEADDLDEVLSQVLAIVGPATGWALGETWVPAEDGSGLEHRETWSAEGTASEAWRQATAELDPDPHRGIPGRAWTETRPVWIEDLRASDVFVRRDEAMEMGLNAAVAIPISEGDEVLAVLLFLTDEIAGDDRRRAEIVWDAIAQLATLVRRKEAEERLADERDRLKRAQALAGVGDWRWDMPTGELVWSDGLARIHGRPAGWTPEDAEESLAPVHPDDRDRVMEAVTEAATAAETSEVTYRITRPEGDVRWLRARIEPETDGTGEVVGLHGTCRDVTDQRRAERELEAARDRLERMLSQAPVILFVLDADGVYQMSRGSGLDHLGLEPDEHVGESAFDIYADHPEIPDDIRRALEGDRFSSVVDLDGTCLQISYSPRLDADGEVVGTIGVAVDVTERMRAEEELEAARDRLAFVVSESPAITYTAEVRPDADRQLGELTFLSANVEEITGHPPETFVGDTQAWLEQIHPDDFDQLVERVRKLTATGHAVVEYRARDADGEWRWFRDDARIVTDADGKPRELVGSILEVTERRKLEDEDRRKAQLLDEVSDAVIATDAEDRITYWNEAAEELYGWTFEEVEGEDIMDVTLPDVPDDEIREGQAMLQEGETWTGEFEIERKDGSTVPARVSATPILDGDGELATIIAIIHDVTEEKARERELLRTANALEARNRQLRNLGVAAAHHLQEPIRDVVRYVDLIEDRTGDRLTDDDLEDLEVVRAGGERLQELVDAFQAYVEQATGDPPGDGPAEAGEVLRKVLRGLDRSVDDLASITWDEAPRLGIDPEELETLLGELIGNAIRFRDGDHVEVHVGFERVDEMWIVSVADDGIGIPAEHHERIFRPLETLHHRTEYPGVGIGLAICRGIVERRGGGIWVKSTPGEGATFYATVPAVGAEGDPAVDEVL